MSTPSSPTANGASASDATNNDSTNTSSSQDQNNVHSASSSSQPPLNPGLYAPTMGNNNAVPDDTGESLYAISARLMSPPKELYSDDGQTVTLNKIWAVGIIGTGHFEPQEFWLHRVLYHGSEFRQNGTDYGLSKEVHDWLCDPKDTIALPAEHFVKVEETVE